MKKLLKVKEAKVKKRKNVKEANVKPFKGERKSIFKKVKSIKKEKSIKSEKDNSKLHAKRMTSSLSMEKDKKTKGSIAVKLVLAFMVPVCFTILVGAISYNRASKAIIKNYIDSSLQAIEMTSEYILFGLDSVDATSLQYSMDTKMKNYFNGLYKDKYIESNSAMEEIKSNMITKSVSDPFIENIHFLATNVPSMTTAHVQASVLNQDVYGSFLASDTGDVLKTTSNEGTWVGSI